MSNEDQPDKEQPKALTTKEEVLDLIDSIFPQDLDGLDPFRYIANPEVMSNARRIFTIINRLPQELKPFNNYTIVLVDDEITGTGNTFMDKFVKIFLEGIAGASVITFSSSEKAIGEALKLPIKNENPVIFITDYNMPQMDGIKLLTNFFKRNHNGIDLINSFVPILLTSSSQLNGSSTPIRAKAMEGGATYIPKGSGTEMLLKILIVVNGVKRQKRDEA